MLGMESSMLSQHDGEMHGKLHPPFTKGDSCTNNNRITKGKSTNKLLWKHCRNHVFQLQEKYV